MNYIDKSAFLTSHLKKWYEKYQRNLPWRKTKSAYRIWLSEVILQQTRVKQGLPYYIKFIQAYPTIKDLAEAKEEEVMKNWQGLGYYSRARNLHHTAQYIYNELQGNFPSTYKEIRMLKGVGDYTAAAISSLAYDLPYAVLDGNVFRILSRFFGIETPIDTSMGKKVFQELANELLDPKRAAKHNQAMMEFAALQCVPKNPNCKICPLQEKCFAYQHNNVQQLPIKSKKTKRRNRYFHYLIISCQENLLIKQRTEKDIWKKLYEFPLIETQKAMNFTTLREIDAFKKIFPTTEIQLEAQSITYKHILSHQIIFAQFYHLKVINFAELKLEHSQIIHQNELERFPIPKLIENYLKEETNLLSLFSI